MKEKRLYFGILYMKDLYPASRFLFRQGFTDREFIDAAFEAPSAHADAFSFVSFIIIDFAKFTGKFFPWRERRPFDQIGR